MNQIKFNTTPAEEEWQPHSPIVHGNSVDLSILQIYIVFTALAIITSNALLLHRLLKKKKKQKTRADKIFIILFCSDIAVGLFSPPVISLELFWCAANVFVAIFSSYSFWNFVICFPFFFSWTLIIIIALDRVFIITKAQVYKKCITMKVLYWVITFSLLFIFVLVTVAITELKRNNSYSTLHIVHLIELFFIFITIIAYAYLFYFVRSKSRVIENKRHCGDHDNLHLHMFVIFYFSSFCWCYYLFLRSNTKSKNAGKPVLLEYYFTIFKFICKCIYNTLSQSWKS